jgi:hypothetical protein
MKADTQSSQHSKRERIHIAISVGMFLVATGIGALAWYSFANETLYSPFGILATDNADPNFYIGIGVYITIGATLLTSVLIRLALRLSR